MLEVHEMLSQTESANKNKLLSWILPTQAKHVI